MSRNRHRQSHARNLAHLALSFLLPLSSTFIAWRGLSILTDSSFPIICVVSESMAPTFRRGDVLLLWNRTSSVEPGDIPVVWFSGSPLPMVHRIIQVNPGNHLERFGISQSFLTKGDNNALNDVILYPGDRTMVLRSEVVGFVRGYIPLVGWLVIGFQEVYWVKYAVYAIVVAIVFAGS
ncbi:putative signal peptidase complex catalytic subunit SEC11 [Xylariomycetidae sp. FL2044]|nr:putative signal peptidase complex catalytic subunit SEC11 [Xylariomycetidae sp. FL2044]